MPRHVVQEPRGLEVLWVPARGQQKTSLQTVLSRMTNEN